MVLQLLRDNTAVMYDWSYFIAWIGVGWALISALLFSGASVCLRSEREREDAKNMAYLMPGNALEARGRGACHTWVIQSPRPFLHGVKSDVWLLFFQFSEGGT